MDRAKEITKTSLVGIGANVGLTALKAVFGLIAGSMALVMDALNNLTDALSSVVTLIGVKLAKRKPTKKHPYGYGRIEYFSAMIVAAIVLAAGVTALVEAIQNIIKNCIEHMEAGGKLSLQIEDTHVYSEIILQDTGCGIAKDDLPHIFERFYKGKNAGKDSVGIGLALAKSIMTSQKGDILVESTEGVGTIFRVRLYKTIV